MNTTDKDTSTKRSNPNDQVFQKIDVSEQQSTVEVNLFASCQGGYDINIGDDDDELYIMSKKKDGDSNRFKSGQEYRDLSKNLKNKLDKNAEEEADNLLALSKVDEFDNYN